MEWFQETLHPAIRQTLKVDEVLHREKTALQDLIIFRNPTFGRVMALDGIVQTTEGDEFIYHEMLAHVPILAVKAAKGAGAKGAGAKGAGAKGAGAKGAGAKGQVAKGQVAKVLIVGGGDGGCIREVLKHKKLVCTMVEIDPGVIELSRKHLPNHHAGAFDDKRANIVIADGARFVKETPERYDVIIIDSTDPVGPGAVLFTEEFYADCKRCLVPGGVLVTQNGVPFLQGPELQSSVGAFKKLFRQGGCYLAVVPTYNGGFMALGWATDNLKLRKVPVAAIARLYKAAKLDTRYFTPDLFAGAFALPNFIQKLVDGAAPKKKAGKAKAGRKAKW